MRVITVIFIGMFLYSIFVEMLAIGLISLFCAAFYHWCEGQIAKRRIAWLKSPGAAKSTPSTAAELAKADAQCTTCTL